MRRPCEHLPVAVNRKMCGKVQRDALLRPNCTETHISYWGEGGLFRHSWDLGRSDKFSWGENEICQRGRKTEAELRHTKIFVASDPPTHPLPRFRIHRPLSNPLHTAQGSTSVTRSAVPRVHSTILGL